MDKIRADELLVKTGAYPSREKAKAGIMAGEVYAGETRVEKPGEMFSAGTVLSVRGGCPYVSRGGYKLEKAVRVFGIAIDGKVCADIGASTGGFTDVMLKNGAKRVYSVDVGHGQLDWNLRNDPRVTVMERTNARYLTEDSLPEKAEFASADVSFISLRHIFPAFSNIGADEVCVLIKPQFEAGREKVGKKGVVRDSAVHEEVIENVIGYAEENGYGIKKLDYSPIKGPNGNIEYIALFARGEKEEQDIRGIVKKAREELG